MNYGVKNAVAIKKNFDGQKKGTIGEIGFSDKVDPEDPNKSKAPTLRDLTKRGGETLKEVLPDAD